MAKTKDFSATSAISFGWETFKGDIKFWLILAVLMGTLSGGGSANFGGSSSSNSSYNQGYDSVGVEQYQQDFNYNLEYPQDPGEFSNDVVPLVPNTVEEVLGINTGAEDDLAGMYIILGLIFGLALPFIIASMLVSTAIQLGFTKLSIAAGRSKKVMYEMILSEMDLKKAAKALVVSILYILLVIIGLFLLVFPGIYFAIKYAYIVHFIVDRDAGMKESFRLSAEATKGYKGTLFLFGFLLTLLNIGGFLLIGYGLLVTLPISMIASGYTYAQLSKNIKG